jgi:hypothetical protein
MRGSASKLTRVAERDAVEVEHTVREFVSVFGADAMLEFELKRSVGTSPDGLVRCAPKLLTSMKAETVAACSRVSLCDCRDAVNDPECVWLRTAADGLTLPVADTRVVPRVGEDADADADVDRVACSDNDKVG